MIAYRIARTRFIRDLSGEGARLHGGRWNATGVPMLYLAESRALAILETLTYVQVKTLPIDYQLAEISFPADAVTDLAEPLPDDWARIPHGQATERLGSAWALAMRGLVLRVPSAHVPEEHNYLVNPRHPRSAEVRVVGTRPFAFDARLLPKQSTAAVT